MEPLCKSKRIPHPIKQDTKRAIYEFMHNLSFGTLDKSVVDLFVDSGDVYLYWNVPPFGYAMVSGDMLQYDSLQRVIAGGNVSHVELSTAYPSRSYHLVHMMYGSMRMCNFVLSMARGSRPSVQAACNVQTPPYPYDVVPRRQLTEPMVTTQFQRRIPSADVSEVNAIWQEYGQYVMRYFGYKVPNAVLMVERRWF